MQNRQVIMARKYLCCFDEILDQMAKQMLSQEMTNNITINFIKGMISHHKAAISMSQNLLEFSMYEPLREMAKEIIERQTKEIEEMQEIANTAYGFQNIIQDVNCYKNEYFEITKNMVEKMKNAPRTIYINLDFTYEMIPHHEGAIAMCKNLMAYRIDPRLKAIAESIIKEQKQGIEKMKEIQMRLRGK